ncbi:MAG: DNA polymerase III subunit beta [Solobacterium sp.]|nr:DNA polymerase III subunit beta [Solobacterium sp.]
MNFRINKNKFYNALSVANRAVSSNSPIPALSGIRIDAAEGKLILTASDVNTSIKAELCSDQDDSLGLNIIQEGSIVIDAKYLMDIVKKIDSEDISVSIIDGTLTHFAGQKAEFKINGYRPEDYPVIDFSEPSVNIDFKYSVLSSLISETAFAASVKETRPVLMGVNLKSDGSTLTCTATDSYRLARKTVSVESEQFSVTVPARTLFDARSIFQDSEDVRVALNQKKIQFIGNGIVLQSNLLEGGYPETDRLIPKEFSRRLVINRLSLIQAIDRTSFIKTDNMTIIRLQINSSDDISLSNKSQEIGESHESLNAVSYEGEPIDISFSGTYVSDAVKALSSENVTVSFTGEMKPFIIQNDAEDKTLLQLVLPVRTYN